jgi:hypothetical protein
MLGASAHIAATTRQMRGARMSTRTRIPLVAAAAVVSLGLMPATSALARPTAINPAVQPASSTVPGYGIPADCTASIPLDGRSVSLTCTGRPAGSQWRVVADCYKGFAMFVRNGNTVTGNGTSIADCRPSLGFTVDSYQFQAL